MANVPPTAVALAAYRLFDREVTLESEFDENGVVIGTTEVVITGKPVLYYNNGTDKTWQAYDLEGEWGENFVLDLDTTPILPGMIFYAVGCRYAIQQPEPY